MARACGSVRVSLPTLLARCDRMTKGKPVDHPFPLFQRIENHRGDGHPVDTLGQRKGDELQVFMTLARSCYLSAVVEPEAVDFP